MFKQCWNWPRFFFPPFAVPVRDYLFSSSTTWPGCFWTFKNEFCYQWWNDTCTHWYRKRILHMRMWKLCTVRNACAEGNAHLLVFIARSIKIIELIDPSMPPTQALQSTWQGSHGWKFCRIYCPSCWISIDPRVFVIVLLGLSAPEHGHMVL